ncbi:MAG: hypothetical protein KBT34_12715 [Prevotella sp.]|nr:hypothetical protein [Candidatus Prevotella equi]
MKKTLLIITQLLFALTLSAQTQQELRDSLSMINRLIEEHPRAVKLRLRKAALNIDLEQWEYALDEYTNVLEMMPTNLTALYYRGFVNQHLQRYAFARKDYETLLMVDPQNEHALMGLILTNIADNHKTKAYDDANRLVELFPDHATSYAIRADIEEQLNMDMAALEDIEKAIKIEDVEVQKKYPHTMDDDIASYQLTAFSLYIKKGDTKKARKALDYLVSQGISRTALTDQYSLLKK